MKRKRVLVSGKIEVLHFGDSRCLHVLIGRSSLEAWFAICTVLELGLGEIVVVPEKGLKCRFVPLEKAARAAVLDDRIEVALDRNGLACIRNLLANYFYLEYSPVSHVDLSITLDSNPNCDLTVTLESWERF